MKIVVLGEGAWGSAIASVIAHNNYQVALWCYHQDIAQHITLTKKNIRYCPYYDYSPLITPTSHLQQALQDADIIFNALPMQHTRSVLSSIKNNYSSAIWIALNKGLEFTTSMLPTQLLYDLTNSEHIGVVMGPSFAQEVIEQKITFVNSAATDKKINIVLQRLLSTSYFHLQSIEDMQGMQWCAVLKNCIALGMGLLQGAQASHNTQAAFMSIALNQLQNFLKYQNADPMTLSSFAGIGDILLTSYGPLSKNNQIGRLIGAGQSLHKALQTTGYIPEAINTLSALAESAYEDFMLLKAIKKSVYAADSSIILKALKT